MPIPKYYELYRPFLDCLKDGQPHSFAEVNDYIALVMGLTEEDRKELLPSGTQSRFYNTVGWTRTYLKKAGLINSPTRGIFIITTEGKKLLEENPPIIDDKLLMRYNGFRSFMKIDSVGNEDNEIQDSSEDTPQNVMDKAFKIINNRLADELLSELMKKPPEFFELLVVKLLKNMGYGGTLEGSGSVVGKSGDEGIDGIIREDKLGFNLIYIQAKRWELEKNNRQTGNSKICRSISRSRSYKGLVYYYCKIYKGGL